MQEHSVSVTEMLQPFVDAQQQFVSLEEGWEHFLFYFRDRLGADIRGVQLMEEINAALEYADSGNLEEPPEGDPSAEWFSSFERREDVLAAFQHFLKHRRLTE
jgi:hypothetical protein